MSETDAIKEIENYLDYEGSVSIQAIATLYSSYQKVREKIEELYETKQYWTEEVKEILEKLLEGDK